MNEDSRLIQLLEEWRKFSEQESLAIDKHDWTAVASTQEAKSALQREILDAYQKEVQNSVHPASTKVQFRNKIEEIRKELIAIELRNKTKIEALIAKAKEEELASNIALKNLRNIKKAYSTGEMPNWQCYS